MAASSYPTPPWPGWTGWPATPRPAYWGSPSTTWCMLRTSLMYRRPSATVSSAQLGWIVDSSSKGNFGVAVREQGVCYTRPYRLLAKGGGYCWVETRWVLAKDHPACREATKYIRCQACFRPGVSDLALRKADGDETVQWPPWRSATQNDLVPADQWPRPAWLAASIAGRGGGSD